jgi:lipid-A-disaccharide synthase
MIPASAPFSFFIVAGEASGDAHGADLIREIRVLHPDSSFYGTGGAKMRAEGQQQPFDLTLHAAVGLVEVLKKYGTFVRLFNTLLAEIEKVQPDVLVLIDYPGFNFRFMHQVRRRWPHIKIVYYVSPQLWAWKAGRVKQLAAEADLVLTLFKFEQTWYRERAPMLAVEWVGHPMLDRLAPLRRAPKDLNRIALLPGSRKAEVELLGPILWQAAIRWTREFPGTTFVWVAPDQRIRDLGHAIMRRFPHSEVRVETHLEDQMAQVSRCGLAWVASGTASLECACAGVPAVVVYQVNPLTYAIGRRVVKVKHLSMVNVLGGREIVPELLQKNLTPEAIVERSRPLLANASVREQLLQEVEDVLGELGEGRASEAAARACLVLAAKQ